MLAKEILNTDFTPLEPSSPISMALAKMDAWQTSSLPVVEPLTLKNIGHILFEDVADQLDESKPISVLEIRKPIFTYVNQHIFEVARQMLQHEVRIISVVDHTETYIGVIEKKNVLEALSTMLNVTMDGSVITVQMARADFTLSELVHLVETEEAKILGLTVTPSSELNTHLQVSIKVSCEETSAITSSLRRHGYTASTTNRTDLVQIDLSSRADELIRYLDV
jgi:predicted transcriptional regulator